MSIFDQVQPGTRLFIGKCHPSFVNEVQEELPQEAVVLSKEEDGSILNIRFNINGYEIDQILYDAWVDIPWTIVGHSISEPL